MKKFIILLANSQHYFIHALRIVVFIVLSFIGGINTLFYQGNSLALGWGSLMVIVGLLTLLGIWFYKIGLLGGLLLVVTSIVSIIVLSIRFGGEAQVQPYLFYRMPGFGQLLLLMIAGLVCASDCAKQIFKAYVLKMG